MRRTGPPHPVEDLREKLNRKRQERAEQNAVSDTAADSKRNSHRPPPDPPSFLRDPLRGDEITEDSRVDNGQCSRGYRSRGGRGHKPPGPKIKPLNIIVEFSNPGERTCTIDESLEVHSPINSKQESGHYRGHRNFRGSPRNRGSYRGRNRWNKTEKQISLPSIETAEDWTPDECQATVSDKSKDWIPSKETTEDQTSNECRGTMKDKLKDGSSTKKTTEDWNRDEAVNDKSKDGISLIKTTEDYTTGDCEEIGDNLNDLNDQYESMHMPKNNAEDFSSSLEENSKEKKVEEKQEEKINKNSCQSKLAETNSVNE